VTAQLRLSEIGWPPFGQFIKEVVMSFPYQKTVKVIGPDTCWRDVQQAAIDQFCNESMCDTAHALRGHLDAIRIKLTDLDVVVRLQGDPESIVDKLHQILALTTMATATVLAHKHLRMTQEASQND
jgi:hypothetical protein